MFNKGGRFLFDLKPKGIPGVVITLQITEDFMDYINGKEAKKASQTKRTSTKLVRKSKRKK